MLLVMHSFVFNFRVALLMFKYGEPCKSEGIGSVSLPLRILRTKAVSILATSQRATTAFRQATRSLPAGSNFRC